MTDGHRICPKCNFYSALEQIRVEADGGALVLDVCRRCRGAWLDWDELGPAKDLAALLPGRTSSASWERDLAAGNCPACSPSVQLARLPVGAFGVDRCPECLGLWFDGGELGPMLTDEGFEALLRTLRAHPA